MASRPSMAMQPNRNDIESTWSFLQVGIDKVMNVEQGDGITMQLYMAIYSAIHNFCTSQKPSPSMHGSSGTVSRGAHLVGEDIYLKLDGYLVQHLEAIVKRAENLSPEGLLELYNKEWVRYTTAAKYVHHLFRYLNRHWVKREMDEGKKSVYDIYTLHLVRWRKILFDRLNETVMAAVLKMVESHRTGHTIEYDQIKQVVDSFIALGLDDADPSKSTLEVYRYHFERPFVEASAQFYVAESRKFLAEHSVVEYMIQAETRLHQEEERVNTYLHADLGPPLRKACNDALILTHSSLLRDEFQILLNNNQEKDMARAFWLLSRIPEGLAPLRKSFEAHVRKAGLAAIKKVAAEGDKLEPKVYVDAILDVHAQYQGLVDRAFDGEPEFTRSLDNACRDFVNRNDVCKSSSQKSPELLAKYTDVLLRKGQSPATEQDVEKALAQVMVVFKYIEDKDVFQKFYSRLLARRLVHSTSATEDAETSMISRLKDACGFEYTNKLQRMYQDIQLSKDLNTSYQSWLRENSKETGIDAQFHILGTGFWPLTPPTSKFTPPEEVANDITHFTDFYKHNHDGRKLTWLWNLCKGEIRANLSRQTKVPYSLSVSVYQMSVLLMFNVKDEYTWSEIVEHIGLSAEALEGTFVNLLKSKLLISDQGPGKAGPGAKFTLNRDFRSKKLRIKLDGGGTTKETKQEEVETNKNIEEDRRLLIQSAMVRIMKARKQMKHQQLVSETINQVRSRFTPKITDIKKCIDILLDKEYIERLGEDDIGYLA